MNISDRSSTGTSKLRRTLSWATKVGAKTPPKLAHNSPDYFSLVGHSRCPSLGVSAARPDDICAQEAWGSRRPPLTHQAASAPATVHVRSTPQHLGIARSDVGAALRQKAEIQPTFPSPSELFASFGQHRRDDAVGALLEGNVLTAQRLLQQALDFSPASLPIWDLMLRCIDILNADEQTTLALEGVCMLAQALERVFRAVDPATWNALVDRFDVVRHADTKKIRAHDDLNVIRTIRSSCQVDLLLRYAVDAIDRGAWNKAARFAFDALRRDPYSPEAFSILSRHGNRTVDVALYEDAFAI